MDIHIARIANTRNTLQDKCYNNKFLSVDLNEDKVLHYVTEDG